MVMVPLYVPAARLAGFTETVKVTGVVVPVCDMFSQGVLVLDETGSAAPVLPTVTPCETGTLPPMVKLNDSAEGEAVRLGWALTVSVTGTLTGLFEAPAAVIVMEPP